MAKIDLESTDKYEYDKSVYTYPVQLEKKYMKKENACFTKAKLKIKNELLKNVSKDIKNERYILKTSRLESISKDLYDEINNLNLQLFLEVINYSYNKAFEDNDNDLDEEEKEENKPTEKILDIWLEEFLIGAGLNYIYSQEVERRREYFNTQMTNMIMNNINGKIASNTTSLKTKSDIENFIKNNLTMNASDILSEIRRQKKSWARITDDVMAIMINKSYLRAFKAMGVEKVVRVAIIDERTCEDCKNLNGTIYDIDNIPQLIIHTNDRCIYKILID